MKKYRVQSSKFNQGEIAFHPDLMLKFNVRMAGIAIYFSNIDCRTIIF